MWSSIRVFTAAKHAKFSSIPSTNVLRLLESTDHGSTYGGEPAARGVGPADASDVSK